MEGVVMEWCMIVAGAASGLVAALLTACLTVLVMRLQTRMAERGELGRQRLELMGRLHGMRRDMEEMRRRYDRMYRVWYGRECEEAAERNRDGAYDVVSDVMDSDGKCVERKA